MIRAFRVLALAGGLAMTAAAALAGPQYVDKTGFAVSGYDVVAYFDLPQAAVGAPQASAVPGRADITAEYNGSVFAFSTEANRAKFLADPAKYLPQFDGHCAFGAAKGAKVPGNPNLWRVVDGKLYLNLRPEVVTLWERDIPGNITEAKANWVSLDPQPASVEPVPAFDISAAPVKK